MVLEKESENFPKDCYRICNYTSKGPFPGGGVINHFLTPFPIPPSRAITKLNPPSPLSSKRNRFPSHPTTLPKKPPPNHFLLFVRAFLLGSFFNAKSWFCRGSIFCRPWSCTCFRVTDEFLKFGPPSCMCVSKCGLKLSLRLKGLLQNTQAYVVCGARAIPFFSCMFRWPSVLLCRVRCSCRSKPL